MTGSDSLCIPPQIAFMTSSICPVTGRLTRERQKSVNCSVSVHVAVNGPPFPRSWGILWVILVTRVYPRAPQAATASESMPCQKQMYWWLNRLSCSVQGLSLPHLPGWLIRL